jgi:hypothetical protein
MRNTGKRHSDNQGITTNDAKHLQAELFNICHEAIQQSRQEEKISPALISAVHKVVIDSGVRVGASAADMDHPLWKVVDQLEDFSFIENSL